MTKGHLGGGGGHLLGVAFIMLCALPFIFEVLFFTSFQNCSCKPSEFS